MWLKSAIYVIYFTRSNRLGNLDKFFFPYLISVQDRVYSLTHRGDSSSRETLSLSELMHAVAIMTHVHALTCFIFACGIVPEIDQNEEMFRQLDCIQTNGQCDAMLPSPPGIYPDGAVTPRNGLADGSNSIVSPPTLTTTSHLSRYRLFSFRAVACLWFSSIPSRFLILSKQPSRSFRFR